MSRSRTAVRDPAEDLSDGRSELVVSLSRERIIEQAVIVLDAEGLDGLSMRRLAERLDAGAMSLYWYFSTKDDLLNAAADGVIGEIGFDHLPDEWDAALRAVMLDFRRVILAHPWSIQIITQTSKMGPNGLRLIECVLSVLAGADLAAEQLDLAVTTVLGYVLGLAVGEHLWLATVATDQGGERQVPAGAIVEAHPSLASFLAASGGIDPEQRVARGLTAIIAGIGATSRRT